MDSILEKIQHLPVYKRKKVEKVENLARGRCGNLIYICILNNK